jgi:hypothetical protein
MPINSEHIEYTKYKKMWCDVRDAETNNYLPHIILTANGTSARAKRRNESFVKRARYTNYVYGTLGALVGMGTQKEPTINLPPNLEYLKDDCTEDHMSMAQLIRRGLREIAGQGRFIMLTDYPVIEKQLTEEKKNIVNPLPRIRIYTAEQLLDWEEGIYNGVKQVSWVKLCETVKARNKNDRYEWCYAKQYREVYLDAKGKCWVAIRDEFANEVSVPVPVKANGKQLDYIPIDVCGSEDNNICVDVPPMWGIAHLGWGVLQNSASLEDNAAMHAQSTTFITSSMTNSQWIEYRSKHPIIMGAGDGNYLGNQGDAKLLQTGADQVNLVMIEAKERQIIALGGHYITSINNNTAVGTKELDMGDKISPLINWVRNLEEGIYNQLRNCAVFMGVNPDIVEFTMDVEFIPRSPDPQYMQSLLAWRMQGIISSKILREYGRNTDIIPEEMTDEEIDADVEKEDISPLPAFNTSPNGNNLPNNNNNPKNVTAKE